MRPVTQEEVDAIRADREAGMSLPKLQNKYRRGGNTIRQILNGKVPARVGRELNVKTKTKAKTKSNCNGRRQRNTEDVLQVAVVNVLAAALPDIAERVASVCRHAMAEDVADAVKEVLNGRS